MRCGSTQVADGGVSNAMVVVAEMDGRRAERSFGGRHVRAGRFSAPPAARRTDQEMPFNGHPLCTMMTIGGL